jgi:hypothetical protein
MRFSVWLGLRTHWVQESQASGAGFDQGVVGWLKRLDKELLPIVFPFRVQRKEKKTLPFTSFNQYPKLHPHGLIDEDLGAFEWLIDTRTNEPLQPRAHALTDDGFTGASLQKQQLSSIQSTGQAVVREKQWTWDGKLAIDYRYYYSYTRSRHRRAGRCRATERATVRTSIVATCLQHV